MYYHLLLYQAQFHGMVVTFLIAIYMAASISVRSDCFVFSTVVLAFSSYHGISVTIAFIDLN